MSSTETRRGFGLAGQEWTVVGVATGLVLVNVALIAAFALTPLAIVNDYLFSVPVVGVLVYGAALYLGERVAEGGVRNGNLGLAAVGAAIVQVAFGTFGAGVLSSAPVSAFLPILGATAAVSAGLLFAVAAYVFARSKEFDSWSKYANGAFLVGIVAAAVGSLFTPVLFAAFAFIFLGFVLRLGWEVWRVREERYDTALLPAIGVYVAVVGVFVHVLQIAMRFWRR